MDKKFTFIGVLCLVAAFGLMWLQGRQAAEAARAARERAAQEAPAQVARSESAAPAPAPVAEAAPVDLLDAARETAGRAADTAVDLLDRAGTAARDAVATMAPALAEEPERLVVLENDFIQVILTSKGAAVRDVALKRYPAEQGGTEPYRLNAGLVKPTLGLYRQTADQGDELLGGSWTVAHEAADRVEFRRAFPGGITMVRSFTLSREEQGAKPYLVQGSIRLINDGGSVTAPGRWKIDVGTAAPTGQEGTTVGYDAYGEFLNFGYFDGKDAEFFSINKFRSSKGFLGMGARTARNVITGPDRVVWASAKNQFFVTVLTPAEPTAGWEARLEDFAGGAQGVTGLITLEVPSVRPGAEWRSDYSWYVGPKEYPRLSQLEQQQDLVLQFGWMAWISKMLLHLLLLLQGWVGNYGVAIVLMVVMIRVLLWPLTAQAARAAKKMAAIQKPLAALREKYKEQPEKLQKETLKLFQENKVNPVAGCFPLFIQIPIFFGLFGMLRTASELRFSSFLWAADLSRPDTVAVLAGIPLNPLPLLMGATMFIQMRMTPTTMDKMQQRILQFMPIMVTFMCYQFSSGLALYWTISNLFSILQQYLTNKQKDPVPALEVVSPSKPLPRRKGKS